MVGREGGASRRRLRAWRRRGAQLDRQSLSTPLADFGPGSEGAAEGRAAGREFAFYASRRRLRASPGGGGGGVPCLGPEFAFLSFTHLHLDARPSYAQSLVLKPSKTVDQTPPP